MTYAHETSCGAAVFCRKYGGLHFLLVHQKNGYWSFPKGHMEAGETEQETAMREIREETGLDLKLIDGFRSTEEYDLAHEGKPDVIKQIVIFLAEYDGRETNSRASDVTGTQLMDSEQALSALRPGYRKILQEAIAFLEGTSPLRLEKFTSSDLPLYQQLVFNEQVMEMNLGRTFTAEESESFFRAVMELNASGTLSGYYKVFVRNGDSELFAGLGGITEGDEPDTLCLEYMLLPQFWHQGHGTALVGKLLGMVREARAAGNVLAITDPDNSYSQKVLLKNGFELSARTTNEAGEPVVIYQRNV